MAAKQGFLKYYSEWRCSQGQGEPESGVVFKRVSTVFLQTSISGCDVTIVLSCPAHWFVNLFYDFAYKQLV